MKNKAKNATLWEEFQNQNIKIARLKEQKIYSKYIYI